MFSLNFIAAAYYEFLQLTPNGHPHWGRKGTNMSAVLQDTPDVLLTVAVVHQREFVEVLERFNITNIIIVSIMMMMLLLLR